MRLDYFLLVVVLTFDACCCNTANANESVNVDRVKADSTKVADDDDNTAHSLRGSRTTTEKKSSTVVNEINGITTGVSSIKSANDVTDSSEEREELLHG